MKPGADVFRRSHHFFIFPPSTLFLSPCASVSTKYALRRLPLDPTTMIFPLLSGPIAAEHQGLLPFPPLSSSPAASPTLPLLPSSRLDVTIAVVSTASSSSTSPPPSPTTTTPHPCPSHLLFMQLKVRVENPIAVHGMVGAIAVGAPEPLLPLVGMVL